jgi:hypothetical protein
MCLLLASTGCESNSLGLFEKQVVAPTDLILNCPAEPLVLRPADKPPTDPKVEYIVVEDQNDYERWNEAVRRTGAQCRERV